MKLCTSKYITFFFCINIIFFQPVHSAGGAPKKGVYKKDVTIHVPTTSTVNKEVSSCDTVISTSGLSIKSQLLRINVYKMPGWFLDIAFTQDNIFKTDNGKQFTIFQVNITADFASNSKTFPDAKEIYHNYYIHVDPNDISTITGSMFAKNGNSYYCPSKQKYDINKKNEYGPYAYILFQLTTFQSYITIDKFGSKEICPSDQRVTDIIPIIVGSFLAAVILITLVVYLIYRTCLSNEMINLVNPESHYVYENDVKAETEENHIHISN